MLKNSARNSRRVRSVILNFLNNDMSAYHWLGPTKLLRPSLPTQLSVAGHGVVKMPAGASRPKSSPQPFAHISCVASTFETVAFGLSFLPRSWLKSQAETLHHGVQCAPLWNTTTPLNCQPPSTCPTKPVSLRYHGSSHT